MRLGLIMKNLLNEFDLTVSVLSYRAANNDPAPFLLTQMILGMIDSKTKH
jgi:hypothetical protein